METGPVSMHAQGAGGCRPDSDSESPVPETQMSLGLDSGRRVARSGLSSAESAQAQSASATDSESEGCR